MANALIAIIITVCAIAFITWTDPKRRRVSGQELWERPRWTVAMMGAVLLPGCLLLTFSNGDGFMVWLGAATILGWGLAALSPAKATKVSRGLHLAGLHTIRRLVRSGSR